jgi:hypothetical protein
MTKEYTGAEFAPVFYRALADWFESGCNGPDPRKNIEVCRYENYWATGESRQVDCMEETFRYRWKPVPKRTVKISYQDKFGKEHQKELVAPEVEAPPKGSLYFHYGRDTALPWAGGGIDCKWLEAGEIFLTREDAQAMAEWLAVCRRGGAA